MALINCPECGKDISETAKKCPSCGFKKRKKERHKKRIIIITIIISVVIILTLVALLAINYNKQKKEEALERHNEAINKQKNVIENYFNNLSLLGEEIVVIWNEMEGKIFNGGYYINMPSRESEWIDIMDNYLTLLNRSDNILNKVEIECNSFEYLDDFEELYDRCNDINITRECNANYYFEYIDRYNKNIANYNEWAKEYNKLNYPEMIRYLDDYYAAGYSDYQDINNDGSYCKTYVPKKGS